MIAAQNHTGHQRVVFSYKEDELLVKLVRTYGTDDWQLIASMMPNRNERQVKDRWVCYLSPDVNKNKWSRQEDFVLLYYYSLYGRKWKLISTHFQGRTDVQIKNRYRLIERRTKCKKTVKTNQKDEFNDEKIEFGVFDDEISF